MRGWLPTSLRITPEGAWLDWCPADGVALREPFFDHTIERCMRVPLTRFLAHLTPLRACEEFCDAPPPSGFIFHMSRCGSTLVSRMLASLPRHRVVAESHALHRFLLACPPLPSAELIAPLRGLVGALTQPLAGESRAFIKFDAVDILQFSLLRAAFPHVPAIFVFRRPLEVLVAQLRETPPHLIAHAWNPLLGFIAGLSDSLDSQEEFAARVLGALCETAAQYAEDLCLIDYEGLPEAVIERVLPHFGLDLSSDEIAPMRACATFDAKRPEVKFEADGEARSAAADGDEREAAERWMVAPWKKLRALMDRAAP